MTSEKIGYRRVGHGVIEFSANKRMKAGWVFAHSLSHSPTPYEQSHYGGLLGRIAEVRQ